MTDKDQGHSMMSYLSQHKLSSGALCLDMNIFKVVKILFTFLSPILLVLMIFVYNFTEQSLEENLSVCIYINVLSIQDKSIQIRYMCRTENKWFSFEADDWLCNFVHDTIYILWSLKCWMYLYVQP